MVSGLLMVQGTSSSAGKSLLVTGLVRVFKQDGSTVAPFKAQNMSLNSYPAVEGGEIGRAQVSQAEAAGLPPSIHMNPVLLKPTTDVGAQVIVHGRPIGHMDARAYHEYKPTLLPLVEESLELLRAQYEVVVIEGAGSPAEINLRENDIVNMGLARVVGAPVILVADIDRGGVFASIYGTWALLEDADRALLRAFVVNKFRGDVSILEPGIREIEARTGMRCLGVLPYMRDVGVDEEDSVSLEEATASAARQVAAADGWPVGDGPRVAVVRLPRISNFTDIRPLEESGLFRVRWAETPQQLAGAELVIIPGSKSTVGDLASLRETGFEEALHERREAGARFLGVCGGYQMLGERILDPEGTESPEVEVDGLGMLPMVTTFEGDKVTEAVRAVGSGVGWLDDSVSVDGYEIHMGRSETMCGPLFLTGPDLRPEGSVSDDGMVAGTYLHGLFDHFSVVAAVASMLGVPRDRIDLAKRRWAERKVAKDQAYDRLAATLRDNLDMAAIRELLNADVPARPVDRSLKSGESVASTDPAGRR
jgi:adenosylcobyric acid synthase